MEIKGETYFNFHRFSMTFFGFEVLVKRKIVRVNNLSKSLPCYLKKRQLGQMNGFTRQNKKLSITNYIQH